MQETGTQNSDQAGRAILISLSGSFFIEDGSFQYGWQVRISHMYWHFSFYSQIRISNEDV